MIEVMLRYEGALAERHSLDFYDAARALVGFERSLALVTHLVINGEIITQAPALKGAQIITSAPDEGSWKVKATIIGAIFTVGSVGKDSPVGQIVTSVYDYVLYSSMGFHVDYDKTLQQQYSEHLASKKITEAKVKSLIEKSEASLADMHRPIVASRTATHANIFGSAGDRKPLSPLGPDMNFITYDHLMENIYSDFEETLSGKVSSYNLNTYKGRMFVVEEGRTVPFELVDTGKTPAQTGLITMSLRMNDADRRDENALIAFDVYRVLSKNGRLKGLRVTAVRQYGGKPSGFEDILG